MSSRREERVLVRRMVAGDESAFEEFVDGYLPQVYRFAARKLADRPELVKDIVQSTVCKAIEKLATFRGEAALMTWLCACCRNEIAGHFRARGRAGRETPVEDVESTAAWELAERAAESPERQAARRESADRVHEVLDRLSPRYAAALGWKYLEELPVREIARRLEVSEKAAESLLTRARVAFKARLVELEGSGEASAESGRRLEFGT